MSEQDPIEEQPDEPMEDQLDGGAVEEPEEVIEEVIEEGAPSFLGGGPLVLVIEAALMAAGKPLTLEQLAGLFDDDARPSKPELKQAMADLAGQCDGRGFELKEVASGWRFQVRQDFAPWVGRLWDEKPQRYTRALLETLALIAYRQPITRGEIEDIRGVSVSTNIIRTLQEREWVRVVGHRDVPGRPAMYATTRQFLDYFNLRNLDELPPLSELRDLDAMAKKLQDGADGTQPELLNEDGAPADATAETAEQQPEGDAASLVSVEAAQAFQEEGEETIEKLFSELDEMEGDLTLTYQDYDPLEHRAPESEPEAQELAETVEVAEAVATDAVTEAAEPESVAPGPAPVELSEEDELERAIAEERVELELLQQEQRDAEEDGKKEDSEEDEDEFAASVTIEKTYQYKPRFEDDPRRDDSNDEGSDDISSLMDELLSDRDKDKDE